MASWVDQKELYERIAQEIEPAARLSTKDSKFWVAVWVGLIVLVTLLTLGIGTYFVLKKMGLRTFLEDYATTFGPLQGYPRKLEALSKRLLVHECRHTTHCIWFGWLIPIVGWFFGRRVRAWCGLPFYGILYGLFPLLPAGLNLGRWLFERDADATSWRWALKNGYSASWVRERATEFGKKVCGAQYIWAWFSWLGGISAFEKAAERVIKEHVQAA